MTRFLDIGTLTPVCTTVYAWYPSQANADRLQPLVALPAVIQAPPFDPIVIAWNLDPAVNSPASLIYYHFDLTTDGLVLLEQLTTSIGPGAGALTCPVSADPNAGGFLVWVAVNATGTVTVAPGNGPFLSPPAGLVAPSLLPLPAAYVAISVAGGGAAPVTPAAGQAATGAALVGVVRGKVNRVVGV